MHVFGVRRDPERRGATVNSTWVVGVGTSSRWRSSPMRRCRTSNGPRRLRRGGNSDATPKRASRPAGRPPPFEDRPVTSRCLQAATNGVLTVAADSGLQS
ncbi:MAG: hypothetical protein F4Y60_00590 [Boseongicola sp. SB0664_bin_43]|uniref:Uncharacterized protein n=1 Tax=Boseongicola sp. SB0664_bin_43 TaxID=2604844 RepID=A0A6B0XVN2_9RHOB|nr:hypothetical protein [Boseongicola sp. SB0664_bin_43]MYK32624.1 hypothetical protein [Boseongicola sp. SB0670_bin_30]